MFEALGYPFFQRALAAGLLASVACGIVGTYVVVKQMASISGGLSHAAFGGVGLAHLLGFDPMLGATGFAVASGVGIGLAHRRLRSHLDTLIAMVWSLGMAAGIVFIYLAPGYAPPDLMSYLFGSIVLVPARYLLFVAALDAVILLIVAALFKPLRATCFDEEFAWIAGVPVAPLLQLLLGLTALAVVVLIRVVGVILVIALLTIPAAIAQQWSDNLHRMMVLATLIGAVCTTAGLFLADALSRQFALAVPTGPLIILLAGGMYGASSVARLATRRRSAMRTEPG